MNSTTIEDPTSPADAANATRAIRDTAGALHRQRSHAADAVSSARAAAAVLERALGLMRSGAYDSITNQVCDTSEQLEQSAATTVASITTSVAVLNEFAEVVTDFESSFAGLMEVIARIRQSTYQITQIAGQSNLLSLNARIEATRAGAGNAAGFGVVAVEIGSLSKRTTAISDLIATDMAAIEESLDRTASRFARTRDGLARARDSINALERCSQGIRDHSARLASVTHEVEAMAGRQVELNELVERAQQHVEWTRGATTALEEGIESASRGLTPVGARSAPKLPAGSVDLDRFEREFAQAIVDDRPDAAQRLVVAVARCPVAKEDVLERLAIAAHAAGLSAVGGGAEPPLETHYRNARILEDAIAEVERSVKGEDPSAQPDAPVVVLGNAFEDYHDLGRRLVGLALRVDGVKVHDLGLSVSNERFVTEALRVNASVIGVSTLLLHTAKWIPSLRAELDRRGAKHVKVIAGGAIFHVDPRLCERLGADGVGRTPGEAVRLVRRFHAESRAARGVNR